MEPVKKIFLLAYILLSQSLLQSLPNSKCKLQDDCVMAKFKQINLQSSCQFQVCIFYDTTLPQCTVQEIEESNNLCIDNMKLTEHAFNITKPNLCFNLNPGQQFAFTINNSNNQVKCQQSNIEFTCTDNDNICSRTIKTKPVNENCYSTFTIVTPPVCQQPNENKINSNRHLLANIGYENEINCPTGNYCNCPDSKIFDSCALNCYGPDQCKHAKIVGGTGNFTMNCYGKSSCQEAQILGINSLFMNVNCIGDDSCKGNVPELTEIIGSECNLHVICSSKSACQDVLIDGSKSNAVTLECYGEDVCKGNTELHCGNGRCILFCDIQYSTSCQDIKVFVNNAVSFQCIGNCGFYNIPSNFDKAIDPPILNIKCFGLTYSPTIMPSQIPSTLPTFIPSIYPTVIPTTIPTYIPTNIPSLNPTVRPTNNPSIYPTFMPSAQPTPIPTITPTYTPSNTPLVKPTNHPSSFPTHIPTLTPTKNPSIYPTYVPSINPTTILTSFTTNILSLNPTYTPSVSEYMTISPTLKPTVNPTSIPSIYPTSIPTIIPTTNPTSIPSINPTKNPSTYPTYVPSIYPTTIPTIIPSIYPTITPTNIPSIKPTHEPTYEPTDPPSLKPTDNPSSLPTTNPTFNPTLIPTHNPSLHPTYNPTGIPTKTPTSNPSVNPTIHVRKDKKSKHKKNKHSSKNLNDDPHQIGNGISVTETISNATPQTGEIVSLSMILIVIGIAVLVALVSCCMILLYKNKGMQSQINEEIEIANVQSSDFNKEGYYPRPSTSNIPFMLTIINTECTVENVSLCLTCLMLLGEFDIFIFTFYIFISFY
eukprot:245635_1